MESLPNNAFWNRRALKGAKAKDLYDVFYYHRFERWLFACEHKSEYLQGARVWVPHPEKVWEGARVAENFIKSTLKVVTDEGQDKVLQISSDDDLPPLRNPDILIGENDLTSLSYLHEPAVLYNLQVRFCRQNAIYTYCGIVLVAINPYTEISIYGPDTIWTYRGQAMGDLDPHIFAVAEEAYTKVEREQSDQSIIVSGESGAGKTVSAKYAMRYFATVGGSATETHVERKVLASSPIMEAIGNAKTTRNDNSSRFGKYIELQFSKNYNIVGASMRTYLLEKSRVVFQAPGERNYHIFYQLCAVKDSLPHLMLESANSYAYLMSEDSSIESVDDKHCYEETVTAFHTLGFSTNDVDNIFSILAGILNLGNISIYDAGQGDSDSCDISPQDSSLNLLCRLLSLDKNQLRQVLSHRKIVSMRESITKRMSTMEAQGARDALAKHVYACLFSWIVKMVNRALRSSVESKYRFIGVLDIYGFETFDINSFEQFCINYANEKLQQQFNMHVFKLEQEEYLKEDIEWKFIDFYDNQPCIDLIECKLGILNLLDEECRMPKGSDSSWAEKLYSKCSQWDHFAKPRFGASSFILKHFADKVTYEVIGFLEKNRDTVLEEQVEVLCASENALLRKLFREENGSDDGKLSVPKPKVRLSVQTKPAPPTNTSKNKKTVGSQFRDSLNALMATLNSTTPHYIRCIKPNDDKAAFQYNPSRAVQQLRACGVLETIRISAAGFPSRWLYSDFLKRYRALCRSNNVDRNNIELTCQKLLENIVKDTDKYKFGRTKIFFRAGQVAYLERLRSEKLLSCCIMIQKTVRGFLGKLHYARTRAAIVTIQRFARGYLARRKVENIRMNKAATVIQRFAKGWVQRRKYQRLKKTVLGLQTYSRGYLARKKFNDMRRNKAAIVIQKTVRGWLCRVKYQKTLRKIILVQSIIRRFLARKRFVKIRREARSAEGRLKKLQKLNHGLENKIISLQQKIGEISKENTHLKNVCQEMNELRVKLDAMRGIEGQLKEANKNIFQKDTQISDLKGTIDGLATTIKEKEKSDKEALLRESVLKKENEVMKNEMEKLMNQVNSLKKMQEDELEERVEQEKKLIQGEHNQERIAHQKLLTEKNALEARVEALERELQSHGHHSHRRSLSNASTASFHEEDVGYASVKSMASSGRDDTATPEQQVSPSADIGLVLKLQQKLRLLENENHRLHSRVEASHPHNSAPQTQDTFMVQELEMEISKLRADLLSLRECIANDAMTCGNSALQEITRQLEARENEITRLKDENVHLRNVFSGKAASAKSLANSSYSSCKDVDTSLINEDGELILAFEAQKKTLRQLEEELQDKTMRWEIEREELVGELERLRGEYEKHQVILLGGLAPGSHSQTESFLQNEVKRLSAEYLELQDKYDLKSAKCRRLQKHINDLTKRLKEAGIDDIETKAETLEKLSTQVLPIVRKKEREYMGMFKIEPDDVNVMLKHLLDLKPKVAKTLLPCLPSYILFMCVRHTDYNNDERTLQALILGYSKSVTKPLRKRTSDIDFGVLWLANTLRFINNLKQYSGEPRFGKDNTKIQNKQCLQNFDLSEFRQVLSDSAIFLYQTVVHCMEEKLQPLAVPAILEHEAISGLTSSTRARSSSTVANQPVVKKALDELLAQLTWFHRTLALNGIDVELIVQCFRQLFYFLCASSLNNLLLRKEYCHWSKGMQIRYNLSHLEQWAREIKLQDAKMTEMLAPIIQASQLLQARKTDADVDTIAEMCSKLTPNQIIKLLNLYTPADSFEEAVSESFIKKMQQRLSEIRSTTDTTLMMDVKHTFVLEFPFTPSSIRLEDIEIPEVLNLPMLKKI